MRRVLQAGGATVLPRTINHLVDNFDTNITFIVTEPHFFMRKDSEVDGGCKYQRLAAACNSKGVPLVSASYVEVALTSPVSSGSKAIREQRKKLFSVLRDEMIAYHQRLGSGVVTTNTIVVLLLFRNSQSWRSLSLLSEVVERIRGGSTRKEGKRMLARQMRDGIYLSN